MLKVLSNILCDLDPKVKVIGQKAGICDGVPSTSALVFMYLDYIQNMGYVSPQIKLLGRTLFLLCNIGYVDLTKFVQVNIQG